MHALKALVIGLGVVILVLFGLVVWGISRQADSLREVVGFGEADLPVPAGCKVAAAQPDGEGRLVLRLDGAAERDCQQVLLLDLANGELRGRVRLSED